MPVEFCRLPADLDGEALLVERIRDGDQRACAELVQRHSPALLALARRLLGCEQESDDAVQDAFLSAFRSIGSFAGGSKLGTWLHRIVVNACLMRLRNRSRRRELAGHWPDFDEAGRDEPQTGPPHAHLEREEARQQVRACIDRLPAPYRAVIQLRDIEELDTDEAARALGTSRGVVKTRLHRARQALRALLEPARASLA
jgi:RNA polymerase sigma-70 factor (ECF subfamily)